MYVNPYIYPKTVNTSPFVHAHSTAAWYPARRKSAWYTLIRFRLIKNGVAQVYDVYTASGEGFDEI